MLYDKYISIENKNAVTKIKWISSMVIEKESLTAG